MYLYMYLFVHENVYVIVHVYSIAFHLMILEFMGIEKKTDVCLLIHSLVTSRLEIYCHSCFFFFMYIYLFIF